jgi:hypothetical protein
MKDKDKEEVNKLLDTFMETLTIPEGHGNAQLEWNWSVLLVFIPFIPYMLTLFFKNPYVYYGSHVFAVIMVLVMIRLISVFKQEMWSISNPFDFVMVELMNFVQLTAHFGMAFYFLDKAAPESFASSLSVVEGIYFSVATIVTLGYGDICPASSYAKILSIAEVLSGVWFIATVLPTAIADQAERMRHYRVTQKNAIDAMEEAAAKGLIKPVENFANQNIDPTRKTPGESGND